MRKVCETLVAIWQRFENVHFVCVSSKMTTLQRDGTMQFSG